MIALDLFRYNARLKALTFAIGICVAFMVGSFAFANGLSTTVKNISDKFVNEGAIAYSGEDLTDSFVVLDGLAPPDDFASVGTCSASVNGSMKMFFAVDDPMHVLEGSYDPPVGEMYAGKSDYMSGPVELTIEGRSYTLDAIQTYSSAVFPSYWHLINWQDLGKMRSEMNGSASFLIFGSADDELLGYLGAHGLTVKEMTGILSYFDAGSNEVANDLWLIIVPSSAIVALLVYSAVAMETNDRARDIAILKAMGASRSQIIRIFLFQAGMLSILGGLMGIVMGIIVSYAISTTSSVIIPNSLFFLKVTEGSMLIAFCSSLASGIFGSIIPIVRVSFKSVREAIR